MRRRPGWAGGTLPCPTERRPAPIMQHRGGGKIVRSLLNGETERGSSNTQPSRSTDRRGGPSLTRGPDHPSLPNSIDADLQWPRPLDTRTPRLMGIDQRCFQGRELNALGILLDHISVVEMKVKFRHLTAPQSPLLAPHFPRDLDEAAQAVCAKAARAILHSGRIVLGLGSAT